MFSGIVSIIAFLKEILDLVLKSTGIAQSNQDVFAQSVKQQEAAGSQVASDVDDVKNQVDALKNEGKKK